MKHNFWILILAIVCPALMVFSETVPRLPISEFLDTEVCAHYELNQKSASVVGMHFRMDFTGTATNNVEIAFGSDRDEDGKLSFEETMVIVGWDCGRYFIERISTGERYEESNVGTNEQARTFLWTCILKRQRIVSLAVADEVGSIFDELTTAHPEWLYDPAWDVIRLVSRGTDMVDETFSFELSTRGLAFWLK